MSATSVTTLPTVAFDRGAAPPPASVPHEAVDVAAVPAASPAAKVGDDRAAAAEAVQQALARAASEIAGRRDVSVENFWDKTAGRAVCRIADRQSGEVLFQSPPDELLRFFASMRQPNGSPLVRLEA